MTVSVESKARIESVVREVTLTGLKALMFDRYPGDNSTKLEWWQKIYLIPDTSVLAMPVANISSLLTAHNTNSAPKRLRDARKFKGIANAILSYVDIEGENGEDTYIPILRDGTPIEVGKFDAQIDPKSGIYLHRAVARLDKGIPNPKERPVLPRPWELRFRLSIRPNREIKEQEIKNLIEEAGLAIGLGTFRGVFGKFQVSAWE